MKKEIKQERVDDIYVYDITLDALVKEIKEKVKNWKSVHKYYEFPNENILLDISNEGTLDISVKRYETDGEYDLRVKAIEKRNMTQEKIKKNKISTAIRFLESKGFKIKGIEK